jgi:single-stranded DNA-binding protein
MSRGTNAWHGSGNVASDVSYGKTHGSDDACNFRIAIEQAHKQLLYIRINVYGGNVEVCRLRNLSKGDYVVIDGELMSRQGKETTVIEVRCKEIVIRSKRWNPQERNGNNEQG